MSADNGIYILTTPVALNASNKGDSYEYRVAYHSAIENYLWDDDKKEESNDPDIWIKNARNMWKNCPVFHSRVDALTEADRQYQKFTEDGGYVLEYGISFIHVPRVF